MNKLKKTLILAMLCAALFMSVKMGHKAVVEITTKTKLTTTP